MHCAKDRKLYKKVQRRTPPLTKQNIFVLFWTLQEYDMNQCFIFFNYDQEKCPNFGDTVQFYAGPWQSALVRYIYLYFSNIDSLKTTVKDLGPK